MWFDKWVTVLPAWLARHQWSVCISCGRLCGLAAHCSKALPNELLELRNQTAIRLLIQHSTLLLPNQECVNVPSALHGWSLHMNVFIPTLGSKSTLNTVRQRQKHRLALHKSLNISGFHSQAKHVNNVLCLRREAWVNKLYDDLCWDWVQTL